MPMPSIGGCDSLRCDQIKVFRILCSAACPVHRSRQRELRFSVSELVNFPGCRHAAKSGAQVKESVNKYGAKEEAAELRRALLPPRKPVPGRRPRGCRAGWADDTVGGGDSIARRRGCG